MEEKVMDYVTFLSEVFERRIRGHEVVYLEFWAKWDVTYPEITRAYGLMMRNCEKPSFPYMAKIIQNWKMQEQ